MEKLFVTIKQAIELEKIGFNESCFGYYEKTSENLIIFYDNSLLNMLPEERYVNNSYCFLSNQNKSLPQWAVSAPIHAQVFDFFEKLGYYVEKKVNSDLEYIFSEFSIKKDNVTLLETIKGDCSETNNTEKLVIDSLINFYNKAKE